MPRMILSVALAVVAGLIQAEASAQAPASDAIRLHPKNPHYFLFRGKAVALVTSGEHYGAVLNPDFDYRKYLDTLREGWAQLHPDIWRQLRGSARKIVWD